MGAEVSIAEIAIETDHIEHSTPFHTTGTITLGRGFDTHEARSAFETRPVTARIRNFRLRDIYFDSAATTFFHNGRKVRDTNHLVPPDFYQSARIDDDPICLDDGAEFIMARAHTNYFHWLVDTVPAVDWSLRNLQGPRFGLLSGPLNRWQTETLKLLGFPNIPCVNIDFSRHYWIPKLSYSEFQSGVTSFEVSRTAHATFKRLSAASGAVVPTSDIIYVARTDTLNRSIENESEVISLLEAEGVRVVIPGSYSVAEQIAIFRKAKGVVGPHGAGLTNIAFCEPNTFVYEIVTAHYRNPCMNRLAQAGGLHYLVDVVGDTQHHDPNPHARQWLIDTDLLLRRVREMKDHISLAYPLWNFSRATHLLRQEQQRPMPARWRAVRGRRGGAGGSCPAYGRGQRGDNPDPARGRRSRSGYRPTDLSSSSRAV